MPNPSSGRHHSDFSSDSSQEGRHGDGQEMNQSSPSPRFAAGDLADDDLVDGHVPQQRPLFQAMPMLSRSQVQTARLFDSQQHDFSATGPTMANAAYGKTGSIVHEPFSKGASLIRELGREKEPSFERVRLPVKLRPSWAKDKLRRLGYYHPLEPSHVSFPRSELSDILNRLSDSFRALSCHVKYENDLLSAAIQTMEQVEFQVSLFESRRDAQTILLELQRRSGDSYVFYQGYAQPILRVVHGDSVTPKSFATDRSAALSMDRLALCAGVTEEDVDAALELAFNLVTNGRLDACRLGMESLETLTDTSKTGWSTASKVAREFISPSGDMAQKMVKTMLRYLLEEEKQDELTRLALHVWANVWQVAADDMETPLDSFCDVSCPADRLISCLMRRVEEVEIQPHHATLALLGLAALCREMPNLRGSVSWAAVEQAGALGEAENAALELAYRKLLEAR